MQLKLISVCLYIANCWMGIQSRFFFQKNLSSVLLQSISTAKTTSGICGCVVPPKSLKMVNFAGSLD